MQKYNLIIKILFYQSIKLSKMINKCVIYKNSSNN